MPRLYLDPNRAFGGVLNDAEERLAYYRRVIAEAEAGQSLRRGRQARGRVAHHDAVPVRPVPAEGLSLSGRVVPHAPPRTAPSWPSRRWRRPAACWPRTAAAWRKAPTLAGRPWSELQRDARRAAVEAARDYFRPRGEPVPDFAGDRLILAGHQPELFHPGVWVKNFALNGLARRHGLTPINLVVDNDTVKSTALRLPGPRRRAFGEPPRRPDAVRPLGRRGPVGRAAGRRPGAVRRLRRPRRGRAAGLGLHAAAAGLLGRGPSAKESGRRCWASASRRRGGPSSAAGAATTWSCRSACCAAPSRSPGSPAICWPSCRASTPFTTPASTPTAAATASAAATIRCRTWRRRTAGWRRRSGAGVPGSGAAPRPAVRPDPFGSYRTPHRR